MNVATLLRAYVEAKRQADDLMWLHRYNRKGPPKETRRQELERYLLMSQRRRQAARFLRAAIDAADREKP
jgi:hypothetical protein